MKSLPGHPPQQQLLDYAAGSLGPDVAAKVRAHVQSCGSCNAFLASLSDETNPSKSLDPGELQALKEAAASRTTSQPGARRVSQPPRAAGTPSSPGRASSPARASAPRAGQAKRDSLPPRRAEADDDLPAEAVEPTVQRSNPLPPEQPVRNTGFGRTSPPRKPSGDFDASKTSDDLLGGMVGEYKILERLGQGGMGVVYRAEHALIGKPAAVKVLLGAYAGDESIAQRMLGEARAVNAIHHPNIVDVFAFGQLPDKRPYLVMELLSGKSLADILVGGHSLPLDTALHVLCEALDALEAAHAVDVIHRDLKPDNIFINPAAKPWKVKLLDFGLAKTGSSEVKLTKTGAVMGTPGYMAPEQVRSADAVTAKTDVYAMGIVAWAMLAGQEPFRGNSAVEIMHQHLTVPAPPLAKAAENIPPALDRLVNRMLAKHPDQRPTAAEARAEIEVLRTRAKSEAASPSAPAPVAPAPGSMKALFVTGGVFALLIAAAGAYLIFGAQEPPVVLPQDRPLDGPIKPVKVAKVDPPVKERVEAPAVFAAEDAGVQAKGKTWSCSEIHRISELFKPVPVKGADGGLPAPVLVLRLMLKSYDDLLITAEDSAAGRKALKALAEQFQLCSGTRRLIAAKAWEERQRLGHHALELVQGTVIRVQDAEVVDDPRAPKSDAVAIKQRPMVWPCDQIISVTEVMDTWNNDYLIFMGRTQLGGNFVVSADDSKSAKTKKKMRDLRNLVDKCRGTRQVVYATKYNDQHDGFGAENFKVVKGTQIYLGALFVGEVEDVPSP